MTRSHFLIPFALLFLSTANGCLPRQVAQDGIDLRQVISDLYVDQALDNLIRASENRPFVQLAFSQVSVLDEDKITLSATGEQATTAYGHVTDFTKTVPLQQTTRTGSFTGMFPLGLMGERDRTLSFHADPITDQNFIYEAYLHFSHDPAKFMCSNQEPACPVHIKRKCGSKWYWVPVEAANEFLTLVLQTSFAMPDTTAVIYWSSTIVSVASVGSGRYNYLVTLKDKVPNDQGVLIIQRQPGCPPLMVQVNGENAAADSAQSIVDVTSTEPLSYLSGASVKFFAQHYLNRTLLPSNSSQKTQDALDNIRLLLSKSNGNGS